MTFLNPFLIVFYKLLYIFIWKFFECLKVQLKLSAKYYQDNKKKNTEKSLQKYQNLSKEEKDKKRKYDCERCKNLWDDEKQKLLEYRKK